MRETLQFAARLSLQLDPAEEREHVQFLLEAFGLSHHAEEIVGTAIRKGISGGLKRRLSIAAQLITCPKIIFLDEPTSGLDSRAAYEVVQLVRRITVEYKLMVVIAIHQPSTAVYNMSPPHTWNHGVQRKDLRGAGLLSLRGKSDPTVHQSRGAHPHVCQHGLRPDLTHVRNNWMRSSQVRISDAEIENAHVKASIEPSGLDKETYVRPTLIAITRTLIHRAFIKSCRDVVAYSIRMAMYLGLGILMRTIWLRLRAVQENTQALINATFFGGAFMSFTTYLMMARTRKPITRPSSMDDDWTRVTDRREHRKIRNRMAQRKYRGSRLLSREGIRRLTAFHVQAQRNQARDAQQRATASVQPTEPPPDESIMVKSSLYYGRSRPLRGKHQCDWNCVAEDKDQPFWSKYILASADRSLIPANIPLASPTSAAGG